MKSYIITETQFNKIIESEIPFENNSIIKIIQIFLDTIIIPKNKLICEAKAYRHEKTGNYLIRIWVNQNEPHTQDDSDDLVDSIWESVYNMFDIPTAIHRVKSNC